jgi:ribose transport system substrate-binding protein
MRVNEKTERQNPLKTSAATTRTKIASVLFATTLLALAGCSTSTGGTSTTPKDGKYSITLIKGVTGDPFYVTMACGAQSAADSLGVKLSVTGGDSWSADVQTPVVNSVIAQKPSAVLIAPNDSTAMQAPLQQIVDQGIKLVIVDTGVNDESIASSVISSDNKLGGKTAADLLGDLIGGKGSVFVMNVKTGITTTDQRAQGFLDEMAAKYPNVTILETQYNNDEPATAASITTAQLAAHPDLAGIFATNVNGAEGTATGLQQAGKASGDVKVISYDAGPKQVEDLKAGIVQGLVAQDPYTEGVQAVTQAYAALTGGKVEKAVATALAPITVATLDANAKFLYKDQC